MLFCGEKWCCRYVVLGKWCYFFAAAAVAVTVVVEGGCDCCVLYRIYYFILLKVKIDLLLQHVCR